jgi:Fe-S-cluster containining protein
VYVNKKGFAQLRNKKGYCIFYDTEKVACKVYEKRPMGCRIYPVVYSEDDGVVADDLCPERLTVTEAEIERKTGVLRRLLHQIDIEATKR